MPWTYDCAADAYSSVARPCLNVSDVVIDTEVSNAGLWSAE